MNNLPQKFRSLAALVSLSLVLGSVPAAQAASTIISLSPSSAVAGSPGFTLTIKGANFTSGSTVKWGTTWLKPTVTGTTKITVPVTAALIAKPGTANVTVTTGGVTSAAAVFTIKVPTISLSPSSAVAGGPGFTLTINGANFTSGSTVKWNTTSLKPTVTGTTKITAPVPAALIAKVGTANVTATTGGVTSAAAVFTINPASTISSLSPSSATAGGPAFTLTINGANFTSGTTVKWGTTSLKATVTGTTKITAPVSADLIAKPGTASVAVTTGGVTSAAATFTIKPASTISSLSPSSATAGGPAFTLTINGANFTSGTTVKWDTTSLKPAVSGMTKITVPITAALIAKAGTARVMVTTGGVTSAAATFTIKPASTISSLSPSSATAGGPAFTLTINGANFTSGTTVKWGSTSLTPTVTGTTIITAPVEAALIAAAGRVNVTVITGGVTSAAATFTIKPASTISSLSPSSASAGGPGFTLTINGANFTSGTTVTWGTTSLSPTTLKSSAQLTVLVPAALIAKPGAVSVTVTTGSVISSPATFSIDVPSKAVCTNDGSGNAKLHGAYSLQFSQTDPANSGHLSMILGSFTADGVGNITAGRTDSNSPYYASAEQGAFTGSYSIGEDDRGLLTLKNGSGTTSYYCFALDSFASGVAAGGRLVSDQTNAQVDSGTISAQGGSGNSLSSVKGSWAFGLQGAKLDGNNGKLTRQARAGYLTLDGAGHVSAGELDMSGDKYDSKGNLSNVYTPETGLTGTYTMSAGGRGTMSLTIAACSCTSNSVIYAAGPNEILVLTTDPGGVGGSPVMAGKAYLRTTSTFGNATLSGTSVFVGQALTNTKASSYSNRLIEAGILHWNGTGSLSETFDRNDAGDVALEQTSSGSYAVDAKGRATLNQTSPAAYAYLVGPGQGFSVRGNLGVDFQYFDTQTAPSGGFSLSTFKGGYSDGSLWYGFDDQKAKSGEVESDGAGHLTESLDVDPLLIGTVDALPQFGASEGADSASPISMDQTISETYATGVTGRFLVTYDSQHWESLYFVSPNKAYAIDISGAPWQPLEELNHQ